MAASLLPALLATPDGVKIASCDSLLPFAALVFNFISTLAPLHVVAPDFTRLNPRGRILISSF